MNWDAMGALGEIVGALAVVLSLVYLAVQVRENTRALRRAATGEAVAAVREWSHRLIDNPSINQLFRKGLEGMENLSADERARFVALLFNFFKTFEHLHYQYAEGGLDPEVWVGWEHVGRAYLTTSGGQQLYGERRQCFNPKFQDWLDALVPDTEYKTLGQLAEHPPFSAAQPQAPVVE